MALLPISERDIIPLKSDGSRLVSIDPSQIIASADTREVGANPATIETVLAAIRKVESGSYSGDYNAKAPDHGKGAYQYQPETWDSWSREYAATTGDKPSTLEMTRENQDAVARWKVSQLLDEGYSPKQIASIWNSGASEWDGKKGVNKYGVAYDVPKHVSRFEQAYNGLLGLLGPSEAQAAENGDMSEAEYLKAIERIYKTKGQFPGTVEVFRYDPNAPQGETSVGGKVDMVDRSLIEPAPVNAVQAVPIEEKDVIPLPMQDVGQSGNVQQAIQQAMQQYQNAAQSSGIPQAVGQAVQQTIAQPMERTGAVAASTVNRGLADLLKGGVRAAEAIMMPGQVAQNVGAQIAGQQAPNMLPSQSPSVQDAVQEYVKNAAYWDQKAQGAGLPEKIVGGAIGGAPTGVAEFLMGPGYAATQGYGEGGLQQGVQSYLGRQLAGKVLDAAAPLTRPAKAAVMGVLSGGEQALSGAEPSKIAETTGIGLATGLAMPSGPTRMRDVASGAATSLARDLVGAKTVKDVGNAMGISTPRAAIEYVKEKVSSPGSRSDFMRVLASESGTINLDSIAQSANALRDKFTIDVLPKMTRVNPKLQDAGVAHAVARIAADKKVQSLLAEVFPDQYKIPTEMSKTIDILIKDNILDGHDVFSGRAQQAIAMANQARQAGDNAKAKAYDRVAEKWDRLADGIARNHNLTQYDQDVVAAQSDPVISANIQRWKSIVNPYLDGLYNEAKRVNPNTPRDGRGKYFGARINLVTTELAERWQEATANQHKQTPEGAKSSNYRNPAMKADAYDQMAKYTGEYSTDARANLMAVITPRLNEVTKSRLYDALVDSGAAIWSKGVAKPDTLQGQKVANLQVEVAHTNQQGETHPMKRGMWVREDLVGEIRRVLETDMTMKRSPVANVLTIAQMMQLADLVSHLKNIQTVITRAQGVGVIQDVFRKMPILKTIDGIARIASASREVMQDTPEIRKEVAAMAEQGMIRPDYRRAEGDSKLGEMAEKATGLGGKIIHKVDTASRVVMNRFFDNLVDRKLMVDTPDNRRTFVNQVGQYNKRLMGPWMSKLAASAWSPFIVAGRTFNRQGVYAVTGNPGAEATDLSSALYMRALNWAGTAMSTALIPMMLNSINVGNPLGRDGTPIGAIDLGLSPNEDGKHYVWDLLQLEGTRRGLRLTGMDATMEGLLAGHTGEQIQDTAIESAGQAMLHPWIGPGASFMSRATIGTDLDLRGRMRAGQVLGSGRYSLPQLKENFRAALETQNELLYNVVKPAFKMDGFEFDQRREDTTWWEGVTKSLLKSPFSASGIKLVEPRQSAAMKTARRIMEQSRPAGSSDEAKDLAKIRRQIYTAYRQNRYDVAQQLTDKAVSSGLVSTRDRIKFLKAAVSNKSDLAVMFDNIGLEGALAVYKVASPRERSELKAELMLKNAHSALSLPPVKKERLDKEYRSAIALPVK